MKAPEKEAFDKYLPEDVSVVSVHSLHSPGVGTEGQPLVSGVFLIGLVLYRGREIRSGDSWRRLGWWRR